MAWRAATGTAQSELGVNQISQELMELIPYIRFADDGVILFDLQSAKQDDFSESLILLAEEMVAFHNELVRAATTKGVSDVRSIPLTLEQYPRLRKFFEQASREAQVQREASVIPLGVHACGTFSNPVPNYTPPRYTFGPYADPEGTLLSWGSRHTAWYACEQLPPYDCPHDFTKG